MSYNPRDKTEIDKIVAMNLRLYRLEAGLTQVALAQKISPGFRYQQIQKYETAQDKIASSRLYELAVALGRSVESFYRGANPPQEDKSENLLRLSENVKKLRMFQDALTYRVACTFSEIQSAKTRASIVRIIEGLADADKITKATASRRR